MTSSRALWKNTGPGASWHRLLGFLRAFPQSLREGEKASQAETPLASLESLSHSLLSSCAAVAWASGRMAVLPQAGRPRGCTWPWVL